MPLAVESACKMSRERSDLLNEPWTPLRLRKVSRQAACPWAWAFGLRRTTVETKRSARLQRWWSSSPLSRCVLVMTALLDHPFLSIPITDVPELLWFPVLGVVHLPAVLPGENVIRINSFKPKLCWHDVARNGNECGHAMLSMLVLYSFAPLVLHSVV